MDLRKIIALTLVIPTLRVSTGAGSAANHTTEIKLVENNTKTEEEILEKIIKKMQAILNNPKLKKEVVKAIYEPKGFSENYEALKKELTAPNDRWMSNEKRAETINKIIIEIHDPILEVMGNNLLFHARMTMKSSDSHHSLFLKYKEYLLNYIEILTMNRDKLPYIPPIVGIKNMWGIIGYFSSHNIHNSFATPDTEPVLRQSQEMLDQYDKTFNNMQEMKKLVQSKVAEKSDAKPINLNDCKRLIAADTTPSDIVKIIRSDTYLKELLTKEICRSAIERIEQIQATSYDKVRIGVAG